MRAVLAIAAVVAASSACGDNYPDKTAACELGTQVMAATVQDRKIIGVAAPYVPDLGLAAREAELSASIAARRAAAWQVIERVLAPVPLAEVRLASQFPSQPMLPAWHTWYARDDFERVFKKLYRDLGPAGRKLRAPIDVDAGFAWNSTALDEIPEWPEQRYLDYLATIDTDDKAQGVGNAARVGYSPGAMKHLLDSYTQLHQCRLVDAPDPFASDPVLEGHAVVESSALVVEQCDWKLLGPFQVADGDVRVTSDGDGDIDLYVRRGEPPTTLDYDCRSSRDDSVESCFVGGAGGGAVYVAVFGARASTATIDVEYVIADVALPTCLDGPLTRDGVLVKADWRRVFGGDLLPVFDTSAARLGSRLGGDATWNGDGFADPQPADIYTVELPTSNQRFRMPALHIMSKELDHWMWITMWWSPQPNTDFGADRPASIASLAGPWRNYKMCVATSYIESDPDPRGAQPGTLGDSLAAVHHGAGTPSWCSNPYLELGAGNAATNCIGCHQHGGTELTAEQILAEFPAFGVTRVRNNFFTDYLWAVKGGMGEDLSAIVQAEVDYWDANDL